MAAGQKMTNLTDCGANFHQKTTLDNQKVTCLHHILLQVSQIVTAGAIDVRLWPLQVRVEAGAVRQGHPLLESGQDQVLAEGRHRPRHRSARGLLPLRYERAPAHRPPPQWRHLQFRPPPPRTRGNAERRARLFRYRQPLVSLGGARRTVGVADQCVARHEICGLRPRRRRGRRHRHQERPLRHQAPQDRFDHQGLSRPFRAFGRDRRRPFHQDIPGRPARDLHPGPLQRHRRHGGRAAGATTAPR